MNVNTITEFCKLRILTLEEAQLEFPDFVMPPNTWSGFDVAGLKFAVFLISLRVLSEGGEGKRNALVKLLTSISKAEYEAESTSAQQSKFFENYGVDNDTFFDEDPTLTPAEKLTLAIFGRKQRPRFYFEVEAFVAFLDEKRSARFREAVGR